MQISFKGDGVDRKYGILRLIVLRIFQLLSLLLLAFDHPFYVVHHGRITGNVPLVLPHVHRFLGGDQNLLDQDCSIVVIIR